MTEPRKLKNLKIDVVALVDSPANKSPFFLFKRDDAAGAEKAKLEGQIASLNDEMIKKNVDITKKDGEITTLKAANATLTAENATVKADLEKVCKDCEDAVTLIESIKEKILTKDQIGKMVKDALHKK
ncbi:MAG: hypothetical protein V1709_00800 [Planctomycetota bacterium]